MYKFLLSIFIVILLFSCKSENKKQETPPETNSTKTLIKYAKGFEIEQFNNYKKLIIKTPYPEAQEDLEYYLIHREKDLPIELKNENIIRIPLQKLVVTSTTHIPMLELFDEEKSLIGFPQSNYISSEKTINLVEEGKVVELGNVQDINTEILLSIKPEAVIAFSMTKNNKMYQTIQNFNIPVIYNGDWLEETPLGRAEWIKFFGTLFDKDKLADSLFAEIDKKYNHAKEIALQAKNQPTVLSGVLFKDKWNLPAGESFTATLFKDANTNYLWKNSKGKGSLVLSFESVFEKGNQTDFWVGAGIYTSFNEMLNSDAHYADFKAFTNRNIYTFSKKRGKNGGVIYFELSPIKPHIVLQDLIHVMHPELLQTYEPYFLERLE